MALKEERFHYRNYADISDGGPTLGRDIGRVRAIYKSRLAEMVEGQPTAEDYPVRLVANENYQNFRVMLVRADPDTQRLVLTAAQLDVLECHTGNHVRLVRLCAKEKTA